MKLIDKSALIAETDRRLEELYSILTDASNVENGTITVSEACNTGKYTALESFRKYIDQIEMKEVDLDFQRFAKEMDAIFALPSSETENTEENPFNWEFAIAKHFYSLGLKAQKGKEV